MYEEILKEFRNKNLKSIYFLTGDEDYMIDKLVSVAEENIIGPEERDFNLEIFYGKESSCRQFTDACRQHPFVGNRKLVIVKEAQEIKDWDNILNYINSPSSICTLIIAFKNKKPDGRSNWVKLLKQKAVYFESKALSDYQIPAFVKNLASEYKIKIEDQAIQLVSDHIGNNLAHIENELEKIRLVVNPKETLTIELVSKYIGISKEYNVFELCRAISFKDRKKIYLIMNNISQNMKSNPLLLMVGNLFNHFVKIWMAKHYVSKSDAELQALLKIPFASFLKEYREAAKIYSHSELENIISLLKEYDLRSKGVRSENTTQEENFKELILKICLN
ncbi:MAG: DNA polymerase III subunit delta [Saprospiraceae bacterium]|nr:DNA polymerase III subunit delta [Saprospiraceae bacterium]